MSPASLWTCCSARASENCLAGVARGKGAGVQYIRQRIRQNCSTRASRHRSLQSMQPSANSRTGRDRPQDAGRYHRGIYHPDAHNMQSSDGNRWSSLLSAAAAVCMAHGLGIGSTVSFQAVRVCCMPAFHVYNCSSRKLHAILAFSASRASGALVLLGVTRS